ERYWPADLHLVGKEIIRFHCVYWPAFLLAAGLPIPKAITAHGWLLFDNAKMSKSRGNVVRTETILEAFGEHVYAKQFPDSTKRERDLFATDVLRYFLLREIPFGQDGSFSFDALVTRYNADLANGYGNLVSRTLNMFQQYFSGEWQAYESEQVFALVGPGSWGLNTVFWGSATSVAALQKLPEGDPSASAWKHADPLPVAVSKAITSLNFARAMEILSYAVSNADGTLATHSPWKLAKDPAQKPLLAEVLM